MAGRGAGGFGTRGDPLAPTKNVVDQEREDINRMFTIIDKDSSGRVDVKELQAMFTLFGQRSDQITDALRRIMDKVDSDGDESVSPEEFYDLLAQKFEPGCTQEETDYVFELMAEKTGKTGRDNKKGKEVTVADLEIVSKELGENIKREELQGMINEFNSKYRVDCQDAAKKGKDAKPVDEPTGISKEDFFSVMSEAL
uniref:EF-hand domain-containing protein n=1 Tax=Noctiluca scintillans TaxID=2966 RepID=A0A7S0ZYC6_NOCSC|mmetsp:Transcript_2422/g.7056  ORF Transcript_2422/g.7056 Transcript_2422/m.7056 type:complete len:198 (+) Transcript_2422:50-643(+)|eukprot:CAMPEP_0194519946 /NCGR_PEP_ID=MMETSP0253-20130528/53769_1 /TAXON_ID=2966 /ORGANISM="Noctiluca scintillans" /LENGTH=197 /DNA_ID=CAMNT_0039364133 /DNA_START=16 /DNA_END=609 /DNA_ORIENTATION=-